MVKKSVILSIIIVSTNEKHFLTSCLPALFKEITPNMEVILIDNNSQDKLGIYLKRHFPSVIYLKQQLKRGFAANNNLGIKVAHGEYILLLNPDTVVQPRSLKTLLQFMKTHPQAGICGPQLRFPDGSLQYSCRKFPSLASVISRRSPWRKTLVQSAANRQHLMMDFNHSLTQPVDWLLGACLCLRREMLDQVGLLDEKYFLYVDDIDICKRAWDASWSVWYVPKALVTHHHQAVSDKKFLSINYLHHLKSMGRYFIKFQGK